MYFPDEYTRTLMEEERKLMRDVNTERFGWKKIGKMIQLNALLRTRERNF